MFGIRGREKDCECFRLPSGLRIVLLWVFSDIPESILDGVTGNGELNCVRGDDVPSVGVVDALSMCRLENG